MNILSQPKVTTHQPIIKLAVNTSFQRYDPVLTVHEDRVYYLSPDNLYSLDYESKEWKSEGEPQFKADYGFSMTSTPSGLVFFGGCRNNDSTIISDLYIYSFEHWLAHTHNASPRCWHAAAWVPSLSALLISGGYGPSGILDDFLLLDLTSGLIRQVPLQIPLRFAYHTITVINPTWVCLYGGKLHDGRANNTIYLININDGKVEKLDVVSFFEPRYQHRAFNFYGNLLVTGGYNLKPKKNSINKDIETIGFQAKSVILLVFLHRVWLMCPIPDQLNKAMQDISYILLLSKGLMLISKDGGQSSVLYFNDTQEPFTGSKDPKYIGFLNNLLSQNLHSQNLDPSESPFEERRLQLLEERRQIYKEMSDKTGKQSLSPLYNERDSLNVLLSRLSSTELVSKQPQQNSLNLVAPSIIDTSLAQKTIEQMNENLKEIAKFEDEIAKETNIAVSLFSGLDKTVQTSTAKPLEVKPEDATLKKASIKDINSLTAQVNQLSSEYALTKETLQNYINMKNDSLRNQIDVYGKVDSLMIDLYSKKSKKIDMQRQYMANMVKVIDQMTKISELSRKQENEKLRNFEKQVAATYEKFNSNKMAAKNFHCQISDHLSLLKSKIHHISNISYFQSKEEMKVQVAQALSSLSTISKTFNEYSKATGAQVTLPTVNVKDPNISMTKKAPKAPPVSKPHKSEDELWNDFYSGCEKILSEISIINK